MADKIKNTIIGIKAINYAEKRNFVDLNLNGFDFKKKKDLYKYPAFIYFKLNKKPHPYWLNYFYDFNLGNYTILHFFNAINLGNKPWVTTFEYYLPRGAHQYGMFPKENKYINFVIKRLKHPSCKKLIALSDFAYNSQIDYLNKYPGDNKIIIDKMEVIHPPQKMYFNKIEEKVFPNELELVFVGADFFRKGGLEILNAMDYLLENKVKVSLNIVSKLNYGDYASKSTKEDLLEAQRIINKHNKIHHFDSLPNNEVINLFKKSSIALLPTYDETYGYTVLEAQACGCPVITTNGGVLKEINNDECGWIIEVPLNQDNRTIPKSIESKSNFQKEVTSSLINIIESVTSNLELVKIKGKLSLSRIREKHSQEKAAIRITEIYNSILNE